jgi:hypothetical protein
MCAALMCAGLSSIAVAQPKLVITGLTMDLPSTGDGAVGVAYDADLNEYATFIWSRGGGYTRIPGAYISGGAGGVSCSSDMGVLAMTSDNLADWADLNCFNGYNTSTGLPNPPHSDPCPMRVIPHRWTEATGWVNTGSFDRFPDPVTGRMIGGTHCDATISSAYGLSDDGRYVLANGYYATAFRPNGSISSGVCGNFFPYVYDAVTGTVIQLPVQPGTTTSRADRINADGSVITGYDLGLVDLGGGVMQSVRRTCVWRNGVQYLLDANLGAKDNAGVNADGSVLASGGSTSFVAATFPGETGVRLVRWVWNGSAYIPENLGVPEAPEELGLPFSDLWVTGISADGNTIVGSAQWGPPPPTLGGLRRPFIWSPSINNGVPIDLETYVTSIDDPQNPIFSGGFTMTYPQALSDDGNAILLQIFDGRNTCVEPSQSHVTYLGGVLYLDGSQVPCDPPRIGMSPKDWNEASDYNFGSALNVLASGSWPLSYQWQREDAQNPGTWIDLTDSCSNFDASNWDYEGTSTVQIRIGQHFAGGGRAGNYRVVISNSCGAIVSDPATLTHVVGACCIQGNACYIEYQNPCTQAGGIWLGAAATCDIDPCQFAPCCQSDGTCIETIPSVCSAAGGTPGTVGDSCFFVSCEPACVADFDNNGDVQVPDIFAFLSAWFAQDPSADLDGTPGIAVPDIFAFLSLWFAGCP